MGVMVSRLVEERCDSLLVYYPNVIKASKRSVLRHYTQSG